MMDLQTAETDGMDLTEKLDQNCQIDTTKKNSSSKKKKNNKKKTAVAESLNPFYEQVLSHYPVKLSISKAKGRHAVALKNLKEGVNLCQEQATAFVVRSDFIDQQCHICLTDLEQKMMCSDCKKTFYCSQSCLERDHLHTLVCDPFAQVDAIGRATDVDADLLRLMTLLLAQRYMDNEKKSVENQEIQPTPYWCVEDLISHRENAEPAFIQVLTDASQRLIMEMPESIRIPVDEMVTLACRINANAHGLGDNHSRNTDVAFGLFPLGALFFNHGCNPNAAFVGLPNGQLSIRTIRPVSKDEELVVTYIDLFSDRDERRQELLNSKHFWCKCKRCSSPMEKSVDRFLQGIVCIQCNDDVYVIPPTSMEILIKGERNLYKSHTPFQCAGCKHETSPDYVREHLEEANKTYMSGMAAIRQERNYKRGEQTLELLTKSQATHGGELHTLNSYRFNSYVPLMNCKRRHGDLKGAIEANKSILILMEQYSEVGLLPANTSEISDFWQNLGELSTKMANEQKSRSPVLEKKWLKEARSAFNHALKIRQVVFGKNHPKTKHIEHYITTLTSHL